MARWLKSGIDESERRDRDDAVRKVVEDAIHDIEKRGDDAVRDMSRSFDRWDRADYRLTGAGIEACCLPNCRLETSRTSVCPTQVRRFAEIQRASVTDVEQETLPGVILGHNIPVGSVGCYVPGGNYPLLASAHMSVVTAKVAGVARVITCAPPFQGKPAAAIVAAQHLAGADDRCSAASRR